MTVQWLKKENGIEDCFFLRQQVFVDEQRFKEEFDENDDIAQHLLLKEMGKPVGTARLFASKERPFTYVAGRICISRDCRGRKLGAKIMEEVEKKARALGAKEVYLNAQERMRGFYEKAGYSQCGEENYEEYCLHIPMKKVIS